MGEGGREEEDGGWRMELVGIPHWQDYWQQVLED
jgi:hypothetical protein